MHIKSAVELKPFENKKIIRLSGNFRTGSSSYQQIVSLFHQAKNFQGEVIEIDLTQIKWFDANLSASFLALGYYTKKMFNTQIKFKQENIPKDLDVLNRNGLINKLNTGITAPCPIDDRSSTVQVEYFYDEDTDKFANYIKTDLLSHRGLINVNFGDKIKVNNSYLELFDNACTHGTDKHPIFTCGQYFSKNKELKFSMVDLGVGFLSNIQNYTNGKVNTSEKAIEWAMERLNSSTGIGGDGIPDILEYCKNNNGIIHIASGNCYYKKIKNKSHTKILKQSMVGTTINLTFRCK